MLNQIFLKNQLESVTLNCKPDKIVVTDRELGILGIYAQYKKEYFINYECPQPEQVTFNRRILSMIQDSKTFKNDKQITISTQENKIFIRGAREQFTDTQEESKPINFFKEIELRDIGVIPKKYQSQISFSINTEELELPKTEQITIQSTPTELKVLIKDLGEYEKTLQLTQTLKPQLTTATFALNKDNLDTILSNFTGEIIISANQDFFTFYQKTKETIITCYQATIQEEVETQPQKQEKPPKPEEQPPETSEV